MNLRAIFCIGSGLASSAGACPLCHTQTGEQVRAALLGRDLWFNLTATVLPFLVFAAITGVIYFGAPKLRPRQANSAHVNAEDREQP